VASRDRKSSPSFDVGNNQRLGTIPRRSKNDAESYDIIGPTPSERRLYRVPFQSITPKRDLGVVSDDKKRAAVSIARAA
jgi:hypothetical protein